MKRPRVNLVAVLLGVLFSILWPWQEVGAIPPFARKYQTACATCHSMFPKLNAFGEAFRLNGYQIPAPGGEEPYIKDKPLPLGAPGWKQLWPQAIWPSDIPGMPPIGIRILTDVQITQDRTKKFSTNFKFPHEIEPLIGGTFGEDIGFFSEIEFEHPNKISLPQAFLKIQDPLANLGLIPERLLNIWFGKFDQNLLPTSFRNFTRPFRVSPLWGDKRLSDLKLTNPKTGATKTFTSGFRLHDKQPGIELNGITLGRIGYAFGLTQGQKDEVTDENNFKDRYYALRFKLGGRGLDGSLPGEELKVAAPPRGAWVDNAIHLEHFGYFGRLPIGNVDDEFTRFGFALRGTFQDLDLSVGYVWGHHKNPWLPSSSEGADYRSAFVNAEYMVFPWLLAGLRWETLRVDRPGNLISKGFTRGSLDQTRLIPGLAFLLRQNIKIVTEYEIFTEHDESTQAGLDKPNNFWIRFDVAF